MELKNHLSSTKDIEDFARIMTQTYQPSPDVVACRVLGKFIMYSPAIDVSITPHLAMDGYWESWQTRFLANLIKPGWNCINVGANVGYYTLLFAELTGPTGNVWAFEPNPEVFRCLRTNICMNGYSLRCFAFLEACGREVGQATLRYDSDMLGSGTMMDIPSKRDSKVYAAVNPIDSIYTARPCNLIKVDAEGMDFDVILGAKSVIERSPNIHIVIEASKDYARRDTVFECFDWLAMQGFVCKRIEPSGNVSRFEILNRFQIEQWWNSTEGDIDLYWNRP